MERFCESLRDQVMERTNFKKKESEIIKKRTAKII